MARSSILVLALLVAGLPAAAVNPLDNDAGSGGDAGDVPALALPLVAGSYSGRLNQWFDDFDHYAVESDGRQVLRLATSGDFGQFLEVFDPDGSAHFSMWIGMEDSIYLSAAGTWVLRVWTVPLPASPDPPGFLHYHLDLAIATPVFALTDRPGLGWSAYEFRWDAPGRVDVVGRPEVGLEAAEPTSTIVLLEVPSPYGPSFWIALSGGLSGVGKYLRFSPAGVVQELPFPPTSGVVRDAADATGLGGGQVWGTEHGAGWLRVLVLQVGGAPRVRVDVTADVPVTMAEAHGSDVVAWGDRDAGGAVQLMAPGVSVIGKRAFELTIDSPFMGLYELPRGLATEDPLVWSSIEQPWVEGPAGPRWLYPGQLHLFLMRPPLGSWTFHLGPTVGLGPYADVLYLTGFFFPRLGLVPVWS